MIIHGHPLALEPNHAAGMLTSLLPLCLHGPVDLASGWLAQGHSDVVDTGNLTHLDKVTYTKAEYLLSYRNSKIHNTARRCSSFYA